MISFSGFPVDPREILLNVIHGTSQYYNEDFFIYDAWLREYRLDYDIVCPEDTWYLSWYNGPLRDYFVEGDKVRMTYQLNPYVSVPVEITYYVRNQAAVSMINRDWSRIFDDKYIFPGYCYDMESTKLGVTFDEYVSFLDDYSDGIKLTFFNKDTLTVEDHIFSGPVFEYYKKLEDELGSPDNFPNALVRINNPMQSDNPLNYMADYGFLKDKVVRFRKKTFKELLPNRTFRTTELVEMLPV